MACLAGPNLPYIALRCFADGFDSVTVPPVANGMRVAEVSVRHGTGMTMAAPSSTLQRIELPTGTLELRIDSGAGRGRRPARLCRARQCQARFPVPEQGAGQALAGVAPRDAGRARAPGGHRARRSMARCSSSRWPKPRSAWARACSKPGCARIRRSEALFIHTTRYRVGDRAADRIRRSAQPRAAPVPARADRSGASTRCFMAARTLVMVDDEASTGNTFVNLAEACRA